MLTKHLIVFSVGVIAQFFNVNAGGGSLLTIPALIFLGLPPVTATATNRLGILFGALTSVLTFQSEQKNHHRSLLNWRFSLMLAIPAVIGSIIGANFIVSVSDVFVKNAFAVSMLVILIFIFLKHDIPDQEVFFHFSLFKKICLSVIFFLIGIYGGSVQVGMGFFIIAALAFFSGFSLLQINAIKMLVVLLFTVSAVIVFMFYHKIDFVAGLVLGLGSIVGSYLATILSIKKGEKFIKFIFALAVVVMAVRLFFYY